MWKDVTIICALVYGKRSPALGLHGSSIANIADMIQQHTSINYKSIWCRILPPSLGRSHRYPTFDNAEGSTIHTMFVATQYITVDLMTGIVRWSTRGPRFARREVFSVILEGVCGGIGRFGWI
eukprot:gene3486-biopygen1452